MRNETKKELNYSKGESTMINNFGYIFSEFDLLTIQKINDARSKNNNFNLNCGEFKKYIISEELVDRLFKYGKHYLFKFENNYGASVVKNDSSYGFEEDLWEMSVIKFDNNGDINLLYDTPITDNVLGYLTDEKVVNYLKQIKELK